MSKITVFLKPTFGGDKFPCEIEPSQSVKELKEVVASQSSPQVAVEDQRLIYKGQVLKDERTVESYGKTVSTFYTLPRSLASDTCDVQTGHSVRQACRRSTLFTWFDGLRARHRGKGRPEAWCPGPAKYTSTLL